MVTYTAVYVFGDSLVDSGNALRLAEWYGDLTFTDLPEGAPTSELGYFNGRFADGYTFADLLTNKLVGVATKPVFPFGFEDPWLGIPISPFGGDPSGNNLNFAYGGAQLRQGDEAVPDLDGQTDAFRNAVDGDAPPGALYFFTIGGNDVRSLAKAGSDPVPQDVAYATLRLAADKYLREISQLIQDGARHIMITGIPDVGLIPKYDVDGNLILDATERARSAAATDYSRYLDTLIRTQVVPALAALGAVVTYVPVMDYQAADGTTVTGALSANLPTIAALHGLTADQLSSNMLQYQDLIFFDQVHPNAQAHALVSAYMYSLLTGAPWVETLPMSPGQLIHRVTATIGAVGEVDRVTVAMVAGTSYRFDMLGVSSLGTASDLADPSLRLLAPGGTVVAADADSGAGFDATLFATASTTGNFTVEMSATGGLTGSYVLQAGGVAGAAMLSGNSYTVNSASTLVLEGVGGVGVDVVRASVSYALALGSEIEQLRTSNDRGKTAINLTGNDFAQEIIGNAGANVIDGRGGSDVLTGGAGTDRFLFSSLPNASNVDRITDFSVRDDTIALDDAAFAGLAAGTLAPGAFALSTSTPQEDDRIIYNKATGQIFFDADGSGSGYSAVLFATVTPGLNLTAADFLVV